MNNVTCLKCKWVYFSVTKAYLKEWEEKWANYWLTLDQETKESFGVPDAPPSLINTPHTKCWCGNSYKNFRDTIEGDFPDGSTISPILGRDE